MQQVKQLLEVGNLDDVVPSFTDTKFNPTIWSRCWKYIRCRQYNKATAGKDICNLVIGRTEEEEQVVTCCLSGGRNDHAMQFVNIQAQGKFDKFWKRNNNW